MTDKYEKHLKSKGALKPSIPPIVQLAVDCINTKATNSMKVAIALSELATFASQLRKGIQFEEKLVVTTNRIAFILSRSGSAKDSSVKAVRRVFKGAYAEIQAIREEEAKTLAIAKAVAAGDEEEDYYKHIKMVRPLLPEIGTVQGMTSHFLDVSENTVGGGYISTSEVGSDLVANKDLVPILTLLAKGYDLGDIPATIVKADENQVDEIHGFPVNALMFGTESVILHDPKVKPIFIQAFSAQLSRRCDFSFHPEALPTPESGLSVDEELDLEEEQTKATSIAQVKLEAAVSGLVSTTTNTPLVVSKDASRLFNAYLKYNDQLSLDMPAVYPMAALARKHMQWKGMKLAAVYAIYDKASTITETHYVQAINTMELFADDLMMFEKELNKEPYEVFADFMGTLLEKGSNKAFLSIHELRKLGYIPSAAEARVNELVKSANSYDPNGMYTASVEGIHYDYFPPVVQEPEPFNTSYLYIEDDMSAKFKAIYALPPIPAKKAKEEYKHYLGKIIANGYQTVSSSFAGLSEALSSNAAISNYLFLDGVRGKDNLVNSTNWLLFDIDTTTLSIDTVHYVLSNINHHLVRGSDDNNDYKYHLAIELSSTLEVEGRLWKPFMKSVATYLGIQHDELAQSQVMFCYADREVLSVIDKGTLDIKDHLLAAQAAATSGPTKELTPGEKKKLLSNAFSTFAYAYECVSEGSRTLIRAAYHAKDLGMNSTEIVSLLEEINDYWDDPMDHARLESTLLSQIRGW